MSDSYRIRTQVGVDKSVRVQLDQDFESLEILSLKILQSDIYTRQCSDYGVVVGRVTINNGLGIPNARISVFIPLSDDDSNNPIISGVNSVIPNFSKSGLNTIFVDPIEVVFNSVITGLVLFNSVITGLVLDDILSLNSW